MNVNASTSFRRLLGVALAASSWLGCGDDGGDGGAGGGTTASATQTSANVSSSTTQSGSSTTQVASSTTASTTSASSSTGGACTDVVWAQTIDGDQYLSGFDQDGAGNLALAGKFFAPTDFGAGIVTPDPMSGGIFVGKRDADGNPRWAKSIGDGAYLRDVRAASDAAGNVFVTGETDGTVDLGTGALTGPAFLGKLDPDGNALWGISFDGVPSALATDGDGNVVLIGNFDGALDLGGDVLMALDAEDAFVAKLAGDGTHLWSQALGRPRDHLTAVAVDGGDNVLVGSRDESEDFPVGGGAALSMRDPDGLELWRTRYGEITGSGVTALAFDANDDIVVVGHFVFRLDLGGGELIGHDPGDNDVFVAKLDSQGAHVWSKAFGGTEDEIAADVTVDPAGRVFVVGTAFGPVDFGGGEETPNLYDPYLAIFDATGAYVASKMPHGSQSEYFEHVESDATGRPIVGGFFSTPDYDLGCGALPITGPFSIVVAKLAL